MIPLQRGGLANLKVDLNIGRRSGWQGEIEGESVLQWHDEHEDDEMMISHV